MAPTGIDVHMRLNKAMTQMLAEIDGSNQEFVDRDGSMIVRLEKALYGCVEASNLWYNDLRDKLTANGFESNPYDSCIFNKIGKSGAQTTIVVHVDDLLVTSLSEDDLSDLCTYLKTVYPETRGTVIDYIGMTFDFTKAGGVRVTMDNCVNDILTGVIVPGPGSRSYWVPTLPDPTGYYYCTLQLGCRGVMAICSVHVEVN